MYEITHTKEKLDFRKSDSIKKLIKELNKNGEVDLGIGKFRKINASVGKNKGWKIVFTPDYKFNKMKLKLTK